MQDILLRLVDVPIARMFVLAAIIFLLVAVLGRIEGKIEPGKMGRIGATVVGLVLMGMGLAMYFFDGEMLKDKLRENMSLQASEHVRQSGVISSDGTRRSAAGGGVLVRQAEASPIGIESADKAVANLRAETAKLTIKVVAGTYGRNCGATSGNATAPVARTCDGQSVCDYEIDPPELADPTPNCAKEFTAEWKCGTSATLYTVSVPASAVRGEHLQLACSSAPPVVH
jgi:hypothetical protein